MMIARLAVAALAVAGLAAPAAAQAVACSTATRVAGGTALKAQPRIVVIPFTKQDQSIRTVLEADSNLRLAVTKLQEALDGRGFSAGDFRGVVAAIDRGTGTTMLSESDLKTRIFEQLRADIYIEVEFQVEQSGGFRSAVSQMRGYLTANGMSLANKVGRSPLSNEATPLSRLIEVSVNASQVDPFLAAMQEKFDEHMENGMPIELTVMAVEGAKFLPGTEMTGKDATLADLIEEFIAKNAWKGIARWSLITETRMVADEVRIPMLDPQTCDSYNPFRFGRLVVGHLRTLGVRSSATVSNGALYIELR